MYQLEETFGYPTTDDEKNVTKDVFERYRTAKRLIRKSSATVCKNFHNLILIICQINVDLNKQFRMKECGSELETIPEDLEIPLTLASPQHRIFIEVSSTTIDQVNKKNNDIIIGEFYFHFQRRLNESYLKILERL